MFGAKFCVFGAFLCFSDALLKCLVSQFPAKLRYVSGEYEARGTPVIRGDFEIRGKFGTERRPST